MVTGVDKVAGLDAAGEAVPPTPRALKIIVVVLGLLIAAAMAAVVAGMVYRAGRIGKGPRPVMSGAAAETVIQPAAVLRDVNLALPPHSTVRAISLSGNRLAVHYDGATGAGIAVIDLMTGQIVSRVQISGESGR